MKAYTATLMLQGGKIPHLYSSWSIADATPHLQILLMEMIQHGHTVTQLKFAVAKLRDSCEGTVRESDLNRVRHVDSDGRNMAIAGEGE